MSGLAGMCFILSFFCVDPSGGMTKKAKCTVLCSACQRFHQASCTCYGKEPTQTGALSSSQKCLCRFFFGTYYPANLINFASVDIFQTASCHLTSAIIWTVQMMMVLQPGEFILIVLFYFYFYFS